MRNSSNATCLYPQITVTNSLIHIDIYNPTFYISILIANIQSVATLIVLLGIDVTMETGDDYIVGEIEKTKRKLRDISTSLEMQQQLLRLIVQVKSAFSINITEDL